MHSKHIKHKATLTLFYLIPVTKQTITPNDRQSTPNDRQKPLKPLSGRLVLKIEVILKVNTLFQKIQKEEP